MDGRPGIGRSVTQTLSDMKMWSRRSLLSAAGAVAFAEFFAPGAAASPQTSRRRIDVHHHYHTDGYLTKAEGGVRREFGRFWPPRPWSVASALDMMDQAGIETSILSLISPGPWVGTPAASRALARECNEFAARVVTDRPRRFGHLASLPLPDIEGSIAEIEYALDTLKVDGFNLNSSNGGKWLGDTRFWPVYEALNSRKAVVLVHPFVSDTFRDVQENIPHTTLEYPFDTCRAIVNWIFNGAAQAFPDIKLIFPHGGGPMPMLINRIRSLPRTNPALAKNVPDGVDVALARLFYDTATIATPPPFAAIRALVPASQILFGTDAPLQSTIKIVPELDRLLAGSPDREKIEYLNAVKLFPRLA